MRVGIVGLGDIAKKAYLPIITDIPGLDIRLCTRNEQILEDLSRKYRIPSVHLNLDGLLRTGVDSVFVHSATAAHASIVEACLEAGVHVFVDKPLTADYEESARLVDMAQRKKLVLMVGFNRRFAPLNQSLKAECPDPHIIILQKNRKRLPDVPERVVWDDFIHVVDTLRYFLPAGPLDDLRVHSRQMDGLLEYVMVQLVRNDTVAMGIMHRNSGLNEEELEVITRGRKVVVRNLVEKVRYEDNVMIEPMDDWIPTLTRRGFPDMIDAFLQACSRVMDGAMPLLPQPIEDALETHRICAEILRRI